MPMKKAQTNSFVVQGQVRLAIRFLRIDSHRPPPPLPFWAVELGSVVVESETADRPRNAEQWTILWIKETKPRDYHANYPAVSP